MKTTQPIQDCSNNDNNDYNDSNNNNGDKKQTNDDNDMIIITITITITIAITVKIAVMAVLHGGVFDYIIAWIYILMTKFTCCKAYPGKSALNPWKNVAKI